MLNSETIKGALGRAVSAWNRSRNLRAWAAAVKLPAQLWDDLLFFGVPAHVLVEYRNPCEEGKVTESDVVTAAAGAELFRASRWQPRENTLPESPLVARTKNGFALKESALKELSEAQGSAGCEEWIRKMFPGIAWEYISTIVAW